MREKIRSGELKPGDRLPSFNAMVAEYGVAIATVDRMYSALEKEGLITRVRGSGTFVAELKSKTLKSSIAMFAPMPNMQNAGSVYWAQLTDGIRDVLQREGQTLTIVENLSDDIAGRADGLLCMAYTPVSVIREALPPGFPVVSMVQPKEGLTSVLSDDSDGVRQSVEHLLSLGHRRIAYLSEKSDSALANLRLTSFLETMRRDGIDVPEEWVWHDAPDTEITNYLEWGQANMRQWLQQDWAQQEFSALIAQNDEIAVGAMRVLQVAGVKVPEEVSIVGFDSTLWCDFMTPTLTSVEIPLRAMGRRATEELLKQIRGEASVEAPETIRLPTKLIVRDSAVEPPITEKIKQPAAAG